MAVNFEDRELVFRLRGDIRASISGYTNGNIFNSYNSGYEFGGEFYGDDAELAVGRFGGRLGGISNVEGQFAMRR